MPTADSGKKYHNSCTGVAFDTAQTHLSPADVTLFGACFCPFVQRVWVALELLGEPYRYYEVDPYAKPQELLEVSPKGLVPALRFSSAEPKSLHESTVIVEYLEDVASTKGRTLALPQAPYERAKARLLADHVNRAVIPAFYRFLQAQPADAQADGAREFTDALASLTSKLDSVAKEAPSAVGLWLPGGQLGWADIMAGPWLFRATNVLKHYRRFEFPAEANKTSEWIERVVNHTVFARTCSTEELYLDSYERYAFNRPNTSQVANAINSGMALP